MRITLKESKQLKFKLNIENAKEAPRARLHLGIKEGVSLVVEGKTGNGIATVVIPPLEFLSGVLLEEISAVLEVIVDNQIFFPWKKDLIIEKDIIVESSTIEEEPIEESLKIAVEEVEELGYDEENIF